MCIIFTCGDTEFRKPLPGTEGRTFQCRRCGNWQATAEKSKPWFTFCFVPVFPLSMHGFEEVRCPICGGAEPIANRPDVTAAIKGDPAVMPMAAPPGVGPGVPPDAYHQPAPGAAPPSMTSPYATPAAPAPGVVGQPPGNQPMRYS